MTATVSKAGPYYSSGEIKFSSLRSTFRAQVRKETSGGSETFNSDTAPIKASELLRNTTSTNSNPIVPDATENASISASLNWKVSQFRNSIKYYYIAQSGTDINFDIDAQSWNSNLNKNIRKFLFVDGTCGSNSASAPAAQLNVTAYNLTVDTYGDILGASGRGGGTAGAPAISGEAGGNALEMISPSGSNNIVLIRNGARIYGGGGGGEKGATGSNGSSGTCTFRYEHQYCNPSEQRGNCPSGGTYISTYRIRCCGGDENTSGCTASLYRNVCEIYTPNTGGTGGVGGNGGPGRGYDNQSGSLSGDAGTAGTEPSACEQGGTGGATAGGNGENGADGGEWGSSGGNTSNSGVSGSAGRAISGSNYSATGVINGDTIKGSYT